MPFDVVPDGAPWYIKADGQRLRLKWSRLKKSKEVPDFATFKGLTTMISRQSRPVTDVFRPENARLVGSGVDAERVFFPTSDTIVDADSVVSLDRLWDPDDFNAMYELALRICTEYNFPPFGTQGLYFWAWIKDDVYWSVKPSSPGTLAYPDGQHEASWFSAARATNFRQHWPHRGTLEWALLVTDTLGTYRAAKKALGAEDERLVNEVARVFFKFGSEITRHHLQRLHGSTIEFGIKSEDARRRGGASAVAEKRRDKEERKRAVRWLLNAWITQEHLNKEWKLPELYLALDRFMSKDAGGIVSSSPHPERLLLSGKGMITDKQIATAVKSLSEEEDFPLRIKLHGNARSRKNL